MLHAVGYWKPSLTTFPDAPTVNTLRMQELRRTNPAAADQAQTEARSALADYQREYGQYDAETVAAVDKFREDKGLTYAGNPPGLVDERLVTALRDAYFAKKKG